MLVTRMDLDGTGSPYGIVTKILNIEKNLDVPVKIEKLAKQLDIDRIEDHNTTSFEGCLVTNNLKSVGGILIRGGIGTKRRRFTIGHELGHFLIPTHKPPPSGKFECSRSDMLNWSIGSQSLITKIEAEVAPKNWTVFGR